MHGHKPVQQSLRAQMCTYISRHMNLYHVCAYVRSHVCHVHTHKHVFQAHACVHVSHGYVYVPCAVHTCAHVYCTCVRCVHMYITVYGTCVCMCTNERVFCVCMYAHKCVLNVVYVHECALHECVSGAST